MSTGGDEVNMNCYAADEETQAWLSETGKTIGEALNDFVLDTHEVLRNGNGSEEVGGKVVEGKTPVVWEGEISESSYFYCGPQLLTPNVHVQRWS
jgi:hexosaminidase